MINNVNNNKQRDKVILFKGICTDKKGGYYLNSIPGNEEFSSVGESVHSVNVKKEIVRIEVFGEKIDDLIEINKLTPGIILMDVEGSEMKALKGSENTLRKYKPAIILEVHDQLLIEQESSSMEVLNYLIELGYSIRDVRKSHKIQNHFTGNIIAIPK